MKNNGKVTPTTDMQFNEVGKSLHGMDEKFGKEIDLKNKLKMQS